MTDISTFVSLLKNHGNHDNKTWMEAYIKNQFIFLGIKTPDRVFLEKPFINNWKKEENDKIIELITKLHRQNEREFMYTAQRLFMAALPKIFYKDLVQVIPLLKINSWWDNTDGYNLTFKRFFKKHPEYIDIFITNYSQNEDKWITRLSIICQLGLKEKTNITALEKAIKSNMYNKDFFIQKAIGWALRDLSYVKPDYIIEFVEQHKNILSKLAQREALRKIGV